MSHVDLVIVNWNGRRYLQPCLDSLFAQHFTDFQVWLVDNGSTDGSVELVKAHYPRVAVLTNATNTGFAAANNQAIRAGTAPYVATLNNDTTVEAGWLDELVRALDTRPACGMAASKMLFADRPSVINSAGIAVDRLGIAWDRLGGQADAGESGPQEVFGACAGAALYRRALLDDIGLFDEDFFAYLEDVDLAWRAQWAGWGAVYVPAAQVLHHHSATGGEGSPFKNRLLGRNKVWLVAKNYPMPYLAAYGPLIFGYDLASVSYAALARRNLSALAGRIAGWAGLRPMVIKRRQMRRRISGKAMMEKLARVESPLRVLGRYRHLRPKAG